MFLPLDKSQILNIINHTFGVEVKFTNKLPITE